MSHLEALQTFAAFREPSGVVNELVDELSALGIVALRPAISGATLAVLEEVRVEEVAGRAAANGVEHARLQVGQDRARHVPAAHCFVEVDVDSFEAEIVRLGCSFVSACSWADSVLLAHGFPELVADLVAALSGLDAHDFSHD